jgi:hypothetical protein
MASPWRCRSPSPSSSLSSRTGLRSAQVWGPTSVGPGVHTNARCLAKGPTPGVQFTCYTRSGKSQDSCASGSAWTPCATASSSFDRLMAQSPDVERRRGCASAARWYFHVEPPRGSERGLPLRGTTPRARCQVHQHHTSVIADPRTPEAIEDWSVQFTTPHSRCRGLHDMDQLACQVRRRTKYAYDSRARRSITVCVLTPVCTVVLSI